MVHPDTKTPLPPPDRFWCLDGRPKVGHLQAFDAAGDEVFSAYWTPTGHYRIRVGWFGFLRLEQQMIFRQSSDGGFSTHTEWRRAPRGTVVRFLRPIGEC